MRQVRARVAPALLALVAVVAAAVTPAGASPHVPARDDTGALIDGYLDEYAETNHVPGMAVRVIDHGQTVHERLLGEDGDGAAVTESTPFLVGSVAKTMTATLVMQLDAAGVLSLDDSVSDHLDYLDVADPTVEQLLTHTAGFSGADGIAIADRFDNRPGAVRRAVEDLDHSGTVGDYEYTSADYLVLGALVEEVTGRPFDVVLREELLAPLGMDHTSASQAGADDLPPGHRLWWGQPVGYDPEFDESGAPYASVVSTLADLDRYARAQLGSAEGIPAGLRDRMQAPQVASSVDHYGFGWSITEVEGERVVHHTGATPGYFTHVLLIPDRELAVVLVANVYAEGRAASLSSAAPDIWRILEGEHPAPAGGDRLLTAFPWLAAGLALVGVLMALVARRRMRGRWRRGLAATACAGMVLGLWLLPSWFGQTHRALRIWMPDVAWSVTAGMLAWAVAAIAFAAPRRRPVHERHVMTEDA